jgi:hypothetical protein
MWRLKYDAFVRKNCKERSMVFPKFGTKDYNKFHRLPSNPAILEHTVSKVHVNDIEKEHGQYLSQHIRHVQPDLFSGSSWGSISDFDSEAAAAAEALMDFNAMDYHDPLYVSEQFDNLLRDQGLPTTTPQFISDTDDDEPREITPVAHRTRSRRQVPIQREVFNEYTTDVFGSPF